MVNIYIKVNIYTRIACSQNTTFCFENRLFYNENFKLGIYDANFIIGISHKTFLPA